MTTARETVALQAKQQKHFSLPFFNTDIAFGEELTLPYCRAQQTHKPFVILHQALVNKKKTSKNMNEKSKRGFLLWCLFWSHREKGKQFVLALNVALITEKHCGSKPKNTK